MIILRTPDDIPSGWEGPLKAIKTSTVDAFVYGGEHMDRFFTASWFKDFEALKEDPYLVVNPGHPTDCYPVRMDAFFDAYKLQGRGKFIKRDSSVEKEARYLIPEGEEVEIHTPEGASLVTGPAYLVVGTKGELYYNTIKWAKDNLEFV